MTYNQAVQMADKALDQSLEALNNGELSKYVKLHLPIIHFTLNSLNWLTTHILSSYYVNTLYKPL